jgi:hypothetical protein
MFLVDGSVTVRTVRPEDFEQLPPSSPARSDISRIYREASMRNVAISGFNEFTSSLFGRSLTGPGEKQPRSPTQQDTTQNKGGSLFKILRQTFAPQSNESSGWLHSNTAQARTADSPIEKHTLVFEKVLDSQVYDTAHALMERHDKEMISKKARSLKVPPEVMPLKSPRTMLPSPTFQDDEDDDDFMFTKTAWVEAPAYFGESVLWCSQDTELPPAEYSVWCYSRVETVDVEYQHIMDLIAEYPALRQRYRAFKRGVHEAVEKGIDQGLDLKDVQLSRKYFRDFVEQLRTSTTSEEMVSPQVHSRIYARQSITPGLLQI